MPPVIVAMLAIWLSGCLQCSSCSPIYFFHTQILTVSSSPPVRWRASSGISSLRFRRKCLTLGYQGSCFSSAWRVMRPSTDKGAELMLSSTPPRHPIHRGHGVRPLKTPLNQSLLQLIVPVKKSLCHNLKFPHCTFPVPSLTVNGHPPLVCLTLHL